MTKGSLAWNVFTFCQKLLDLVAVLAAILSLLPYVYKRSVSSHQKQIQPTKSIPVHSFILSSHFFFCLYFLLFHLTVPCRIIFATPEDLEMWPNHLSFHFFTKVRNSPCFPMAAWVFLRTSSMVTWSLYKVLSNLRYHLISKACVLFSSSAIKIHNSQVYRDMLFLHTG